MSDGIALQSMPHPYSEDLIRRVMLAINGPYNLRAQATAAIDAYLQHQTAFDEAEISDAAVEIITIEVKMDEPILQFFDYAHLPVHLQQVSQRFGELATALVKDLPRNPERTTALRKLLEAKDCAVRAVLFKG